MSYNLGSFKLDVISDGTFYLDGGAMFGVVPRVVWEKVMPPDDRHRIRLGLNTLLVRTPHETILIDTGIGTKWNAKQVDMYGIRHETTVPQSLAAIGLEVSDITLVINTHLHFDHAGGNTIRREDGSLTATFPQARYLVQQAEYEHACSPHERDRASYMAENWEPLLESGQLEFTQGTEEVSPGVTVIPIRGHNDFTQCVSIRSDGQTAFFWADVIPTTNHLPFAWVMGYDLYPVELVENKKQWIPRAAQENWVNIFEHDADCPMTLLIAENGKYKPAKLNLPEALSHGNS
ncbi:MAG: MBL fold metallo-hydrolase [Blastocatellia bacterium]|nr:MBL fold metallo-hydrolase [Blastocatellia bacterium]